jgi:protein-tyrosine phosphatase
MSRIKDDVYWVIEDRILGVRKPTTFEEVEELKRLNVSGIISLLDDTENHDLYTEAKIDFEWIPVKGGSVPSREQILNSLQFVQDKWSNNEAVAVHCTGGRKRTGTMIIAILILNGEKFEAAMEKLRSANPEVNLNEGQIDFLKNL